MNAPHRSDALEAFAATTGTESIELGSAAGQVAATLGHGGPAGTTEARLSTLARAVPGTGIGAVADHLCGAVGLRGNQEHYYDPRNSMVPEVLDRGRGIPITLSIIAVDVARRIGTDASIVAMPGHVLVGNGNEPTGWIDMFDGGRRLDAVGAHARFVAIHGSDTPFDPEYLGATPDRLVLARLLGNLMAIYARNGDAQRLLRVLELHDALALEQGVRRPAVAAALAAVGRYAEAADLWEAEAASVGTGAAEQATARARVMRARLN